MKIMLIGEAYGENEERFQMPFVGPAVSSSLNFSKTRGSTVDNATSQTSSTSDQLETTLPACVEIRVRVYLVGSLSSLENTYLLNTLEKLKGLRMRWQVLSLILSSLLEEQQLGLRLAEVLSVNLVA